MSEAEYVRFKVPEENHCEESSAGEIMNVLSFSLYGSSPRYCVGMIRNAELAPKIYPGWKVWVFIDSTVLPDVTAKLVDLGCVLEGMTGDIPPMMQRFLIADNPAVDRFCIRDSDSRVGPEEARAVQEWIDDDTCFHFARAHPAHCRPINGGMWGATWHRPNWSAPEMVGMLKDYLANEGKAYQGNDADQHALAVKVWPWARSSCTQHSSVCLKAYPGSKPFPMAWPEGRFFGQVVSILPDGTEEFRKD